MGLETATYIHQLDPANPVGGSDPKSQGDDHFHVIKDTLQNTFPNIEGAMTASHTELNILDGATLSTAELNRLDGISAALGAACMCEIALLRFSGVPGTIEASHNIASVNVTGTNQYTVNFSAAMGATPFVIAVVSGSAVPIQVNWAGAGSCFVSPGAGSPNRDFTLIAIKPNFTLDNP
jgi:hypothetical protein